MAANGSRSVPPVADLERLRRGDFPRSLLVEVLFGLSGERATSVELNGSRLSSEKRASPLSFTRLNVKSSSRREEGEAPERTRDKDGRGGVDVADVVALLKIEDCREFPAGSLRALFRLDPYFLTGVVRSGRDGLLMVDRK